MEKYRESLDFLNVLSCPDKLPRLESTNIPFLGISVKLRDYQLEGITWLRFLKRFGLHGILADEMGLGKTLQILCLLSMELNENNTEGLSQKYPSLIICPRTLVDHWCNEWHNYFPTQNAFYKFENNQDFTAILTNESPEAIFVISYEEIRSIKKINEISWNYVILDEGHCIRNPNTQIFKTIVLLKAKNRLILSGTPVQNSPADLWALFTFLMPEYLFSKSDFHIKFMKQIMACRNPKATEAQTTKAEEALKNLHARVLPFIMRRLKSDVLKELPEKVIQDYSCSLTKIQRKIYEKIVDSCIGVGKTHNKSEKHDEMLLSPLQVLILLRKLVDHPILIYETLKNSDKDLIKEVTTNYEQSGKMVALKELLEECQIIRCWENPITPFIEKQENGDSDCEFIEHVLNTTATLPQRALIFCQWRSTIDLIADYLDQGVFGEGISYLRLDGTVPPNERQNLVDRFNEDSSIDLMLLSTHIGGVGLTLTGANVVIFVDHDWNPIKDLQAIDRAHRLGQTRTVNVYRLITKASIEEKVMRYQKFKTDTANVLVGADNRSLAAMSSGELKDLLSLGNDNSFTKNEEKNDSFAATKRRKLDNTSEGVRDSETVKYSLKELWDESQYDKQHDVQAFIQTASGV